MVVADDSKQRLHNTEDIASIEEAVLEGKYSAAVDSLEQELRKISTAEKIIDGKGLAVTMLHLLHALKQNLRNIYGDQWMAHIDTSSVAQGEEQPLCSFCGKNADEVKCLVQGPGVYICDECSRAVMIIIDGFKE